MPTWKITLVASLIGTAAGFWVWELNWTSVIWPSHPQLAGFLLTLFTTVAVRLAWPTKKSNTSSGV